MLTEEQALCPKCKLDFTDLNPPRLLTMCGHTFCDKCIRELMSKKKTGSKYKVVCPLDKMAMQLAAPNPTCFPKNLSVLNLAKKKVESDLANNRMSDITRCKSVESFRSGGTLAGIQHEMVNTLCPKKQEAFDQKRRPSFFSQQINHNTCLLHQKPLELVCARDFQKICSSCVIFGEHRGHTVKSVVEAESTIKNLYDKLKRFQQEYKRCFQQLQSKQMVARLDMLLQSKKIELSQAISQKFKNLLEQVLQIEKKTLNKLDKKLQEYKVKIHANASEKKGIKQKYQDWQSNLQQKLEILEDDNEEQRLKIGLKSDNFVEASEKNLQLFKSLQTQIIKESEQLLDNLALHSDEQEIRKHLKEYCKFQDCSNSFLDMNASRITTILHEQILLDDIEEPVTNRSFLREPLVEDKDKYEVRVRKMVSSSVFQSANSRLNRMESIYKDRNFCSPQRKNSGLKSNKALMFGTQRSSVHAVLKSKAVPAKYEERVEGILGGCSDTLDLTNGELGNEKVLAMIECLKDSPAAILKLVRNRLSDQFVVKSVPYLSATVMLNLSRNELTERAVECILNVRKGGGLKLLKSLMIGQNKIVERKNKEMFEELRRLGVNICI